MTSLYQGTSLEHAIEIAKFGALLSTIPILSESEIRDIIFYPFFLIVQSLRVT